jgi:hypothetical protein
MTGAGTRNDASTRCKTRPTTNLTHGRALDIFTTIFVRPTRHVRAYRVEYGDQWAQHAGWLDNRTLGDHLGQKVDVAVFGCGYVQYAIIDLDFHHCHLDRRES